MAVKNIVEATKIGSAGPFGEEKSWNKSLEKSLFREWEKLGQGSFDLSSNKPLFIIDTPPPYPSGRPWHIGGASHYAQIDMIARTARMRGYEVLFPIGLDRNGLPVEIYTEKKYKISMKTTPREKFIKLCSVALDDLEQEMLQIFKLMGMSGDYTHKYRTDNPEYRKLTQSTFIEQWKKGRIYKGTRPSNFCVDCGTTIADAEIEYKDLHAKLVFFSFQIMGKPGEKIPIATTRPELIATCQAVIVNPEDERYKNLVGKKAKLPFYEREVPVIAHSSAKPEFGTGAVMVCSYGDYNDVLLFRELSLKEIIAIGLDGRMTEVAGRNLSGLRVQAAREKMIALLRENSLLEKVTSIEHRTPMCERSDTPIEIVPMEEYYLKVVDVKDKLREIALGLKFHPEMHRTILLNWIEVALDWPISRRRFYGTEIPVWYCSKCTEPYLPTPGGYLQPWKDSPPGNPDCAKCGSSEFFGDTRTFDTWMDSSVSALYITKYLKDETFHARTYPANIRPQGKDIIRTWLHYSILRCWQLTGEVPWPDVWITGWGLDEKGEKMSKSRGNVIDPIEILEKYGAENFRLWMASEVSVGSDYVCSEQKIAGTGKFLTKIWNIARFISAYPKPEEEPAFDYLTPTDRWILTEVNRLVERCLKGYEDYNFFIPANEIRDFTWNTFAAHYVELAKGRAYGEGFPEREKISAWYTLHECIRTILLLLSPICPFITDAIWRRLYNGETIYDRLFPEPKKLPDTIDEMGKELLVFNSQVWNEKKAKGLSLKDPISVQVPERLKSFEQDLKAMHNIS